MDTKDVSILIYLDQLKSLSRTSKKLFMSQTRNNVSTK